MLKIGHLLLAASIGYICGALPFGYWYVKVARRRDIRDIGSGRTGGTNAYRAAGAVIGLLTGLSDIIKGFAAITLTRLLLGDALGENWLPWALATSAVMAVIGHNWSVFLKWGGGAGTTPNVGWATALWWPVFPIALLVMAIMLVGVGMASVLSLVVAAILPIIFAVRYLIGLDTTAAYMVGGILSAVVVTWALRPNIKRLLEGTERVIGPRAKRRRTRKAES
jgi:glycerol-3-phosphate acyltransferase PlsY